MTRVAYISPLVCLLFTLPGCQHGTTSKVTELRSVPVVETTNTLPGRAILVATSFRFENPEMQRELWATVEHLGLGVRQEPDGTLRFQAENWVAINTEALKLRDKRFGKWYFVLPNRDGTVNSRFLQLLRAHSLPYEVEFHDIGVVLLLPTSDESKHREIMLE